MIHKRFFHLIYLSCLINSSVLAVQLQFNNLLLRCRSQRLNLNSLENLKLDINLQKFHWMKSVLLFRRLEMNERINHFVSNSNTPDDVNISFRGILLSIKGKTFLFLLNIRKVKFSASNKTRKESKLCSLIVTNTFYKYHLQTTRRFIYDCHLYFLHIPYCFTTHHDAFSQHKYFHTFLAPFSLFWMFFLLHNNNKSCRRFLKCWQLRSRDNTNVQCHDATLSWAHNSVEV